MAKSKEQLLEDAKALGVTLKGDENIKDLGKLIKNAKKAGSADPAAPKGPAVTPAEQNEQVQKEAKADFSFATNPIKLNRAIAYVRGVDASLKGKALEEAVKARYVELKGLLAQEKDQIDRKGKNEGKVVNVADNDGSKDD